jgi:uncharacterized membrane protein
MNFLIQFTITLVIFSLVDLLWLVKVAPKMYRHFIGHLMADKINRVAALLFYVIYIVGLVFFVIAPRANDAGSAFLVGALFGFVTYATYDLTNLATLKAWPIKITLIDLAWGALVTGTTSGLVVLIMNGFGL